MADVAGHAAEPMPGSVTVQHQASRDDRIFPSTRWIAALVPPFLIAAFVILYLLPNDTDKLFAWTIKPQITAMIMGAGYISGCYFFIRLALGGRWHWFTVGFLPVAVFTWFTAVATLLHWDRFNQSHLSFYIWVVLYAITPILIPVLWLRNRVVDPGTGDPADATVSRPVRLVVGLVGATLLGIGLVMFIFPDVALGVWPWPLTFITSRVMGGWVALPGAVALSLASDHRWSAWRVMMHSEFIAMALLLVAAARAWDEFDKANPATWILVGAISLLLVGGTALYVQMERLTRARP
jgi:uncharacterized membrane protein